ncbi:hypothetical protein [Streptomyces sp. NPDC048603]|uniref:hypothetical protein n=1 Tax=Streptomyces sp. NPDC048603 TaxID=3365577 RepID=UPI00371BE19B
MGGEERGGAEMRSFLTCTVEVARLLGIEDRSTVQGGRRAREVAHAVRRPLLERESLPEEAFAALMAAAVHDPDPSFCRWFVEPALYLFGRRRVLEALVDYLRTGTDTERVRHGQADDQGGIAGYLLHHSGRRAGQPVTVRTASAMVDDLERWG